LQQHDFAIPINGPFDVLGAAHVPFDVKGHGGQFDDLSVGQGGLGAIRSGIVQPANALAWVTDIFLRLAGDVAIAHRQGRRFCHPEQIRCRGAVYYRLGQSPGAIDDHGLIPDIHGVG
jgi:hypothetical protein